MNKALDLHIKNYLDTHKEAFIKELKHLISINSVGSEAVGDMPYGEGVAEAISYMLSLCEAAGLETKNYDNHCGEATLGQGDESVASLSHVDVVPVDEGWSHDPFAGEMEGNLMYGRGVVDNKGPALCSLYALRALMDAGVDLKRQIKLIFGGNEERGMSGIRHYLEKTAAPTYAFTPDARFPVIYAEKNIIQGEYAFKITGATNLTALSGGSRPNVVPAKAMATIQGQITAEGFDKITAQNDQDGSTSVTAQGLATHASAPGEGDNAILTLLGYLCETLDDTDGAKGIIEKLYKGFRDMHGLGLGAHCTDESLGDITLNAGLISLNGNTITVGFDIRQPMSCGIDCLLEKLEAAFPDAKLTTEIQKGLYWPTDHPLVKTLMGVYQDVTGDTETKAQAIGGGTYARTLPCAVAFGPEMPGSHQMGNVHTNDEYADIEELLLGARIYAHALYELANM